MCSPVSVSRVGSLTCHALVWFPLLTIKVSSVTCIYKSFWNVSNAARSSITALEMEEKEVNYCLSIRRDTELLNCVKPDSAM